jgi:hypothetical protein
MKIIYIGAAILVVLILLYFTNQEEGYSHVPPDYPPDYVRECACKKNKTCNNSRCIYSTLNECKDICPNACKACPGGKFMCDSGY